MLRCLHTTVCTVTVHCCNTALCKVHNLVSEHCTTRKTRLKTPQNTFCTQNTFENTAKHVLCAHCDTLQHTATHCNTLQHTVTHCNTRFALCTVLAPQCALSVCLDTVQCSATRCNTLQYKTLQNTFGVLTPHYHTECVAVCCSVLQCVAVCCSVLQCVTRLVS